MHASQLRNAVRAFSSTIRRDPRALQPSNPGPDRGPHPSTPLDKARPHGCGKGGPHSGYRQFADQDEGGGSSPPRPTISALTRGNACHWYSRAKLSWMDRIGMRPELDSHPITWTILLSRAFALERFPWLKPLWGAQRCSSAYLCVRRPQGPGWACAGIEPGAMSRQPSEGRKPNRGLSTAT